MLKLFAPFLPFVTEEVWSWWQDGSVHQATWPTSAEVLTAIDDASQTNVELVALAAETLSQLRKVKSEAKVSMKAELEQVTFAGEAQALDLLKMVEVDLIAAGRITGEINYVTSEEVLAVTATIVVSD